MALQWDSKQAYGGTATQLNTSFELGGYFHAVTGYPTATLGKAHWRYDPGNNTWTQKADFGGAGRRVACGFSASYDDSGTPREYGYVTGGFNDSFTNYKDVWRYDAGANSWTQMADFNANVRYYQQAGTVIAGGYKDAYVGLGTTTGNPRIVEWYKYNPASDTWTQKANFTGNATVYTGCFVVGSSIYIACGQDVSSGATRYKTCYAYDTGANSWTAKASLPGGAVARDMLMAGAIDGKGYIIGGYDGANTLDEVWQYDPTGDSWAQDTDYPSNIRAGVCRAINDVLYVTTGHNGTAAVATTYAGSIPAPPATSIRPFVMWY